MSAPRQNKQLDTATQSWETRKPNIDYFLHWCRTMLTYNLWDWLRPPMRSPKPGKHNANLLRIWIHLKRSICTPRGKELGGRWQVDIYNNRKPTNDCHRLALMSMSNYVPSPNLTPVWGWGWTLGSKVVAVELSTPHFLFDFCAHHWSILHCLAKIHNCWR